MLWVLIRSALFSRRNKKVISSDIIKLNTEEEEVLIMNEIIHHIALSVEKELSKKKNTCWTGMISC